MKNQARKSVPATTTTSGAKPAAPRAERATLGGARAKAEPAIAHAAEVTGAHASPANEGASKNEGEGSRTASRRYDAGVVRSVAAGDSERLAKEAEKALEGPEGPELRKAEAAAKQGHAR
jgi:hypothetical protein